jgi:hypothetical protein
MLSGEAAIVTSLKLLQLAKSIDADTVSLP